MFTQGDNVMQLNNKEARSINTFCDFSTAPNLTETAGQNWNDGEMTDFTKYS